MFILSTCQIFNDLVGPQSYDLMVDYTPGCDCVRWCNCPEEEYTLVSLHNASGARIDDSGVLQDAADWLDTAAGRRAAVSARPAGPLPWALSDEYNELVTLLQSNRAP